MDVELMLVTRTEMHSDDKWYVEAYRVYLNLVWLQGIVGGGASDVAGGADYSPTAASMEALAWIEKDLAAAEKDYAAVIEKDLPAFNKANAGKGLAIK